MPRWERAGTRREKIDNREKVFWLIQSYVKENKTFEFYPSGLSSSYRALHISNILYTIEVKHRLIESKKDVYPKKYWVSQRVRLFARRVAGMLAEEGYEVSPYDVFAEINYGNAVRGLGKFAEQNTYERVKEKLGIKPASLRP